MSRSIISALDRRPAGWLLLGVALITTANLRFGVDALAWIAFVPFLRYLRLRTGWRAGMALLLAGTTAWCLTVIKITTAPLPLALSLMFGLPIGLFMTAPFLLLARARARTGSSSFLLFPALMVVAEWLQHALSPFASWGAAAYTQLDNIALLQLASVTGMAGVSFAIYLVNAALDEALQAWQEGTPWAGRGAIVAAVLLGLHVAGGVRIALDEARGGVDTIRVAAVGTDSSFSGLPLPEASDLAVIDDGLEQRTRTAAAAGAEVVVWNEAATLVMPIDQDKAAARWAMLADELDIELVVAWVVPVSTSPLRYENQSITFRPDGTTSPAYLKHHPVPGEPAIKGTGPVPTIVAGGDVSVGTAICYDADFPRLGLEHARADIDLLALPSSDWRGIDPIHTRMARLRAIEGGHSVLRSTRFGLSAGIDPIGRFRGQMSSFDGSDVLVVELPRQGRKTVYGALGDWLVVLCALGLGALAIRQRGLSLAAWARLSPLLESGRS